MAPYKGTVILVGQTLVWTTSAHYAASAERAGFNKQADVFGMDVSLSRCGRFSRKDNKLYVCSENVEIPLI